MLLSVGVALAAGNSVARRLETSRAVGRALVVSVGLIIAATLTPLKGAIESGLISNGTCDVSRLGLAPLWRLPLTSDDPVLNILLFIPLGISIGISRSPRRARLIIAAVALPFVVELAQLLLPVLDRSCETGDVVDNLTGLVLGLAVGATISAATARYQPSRD